MEAEKRNHHTRKLIVAISFYDLGQRKPSSEELVEIAKQFNYEAGAAFLARLNVCVSLAIASRDEKIYADVQEKLTSSVLSPARPQEVLNVFGDKLYRTAVVLNRAQILVGIKLLALYAPRENGNTLEAEADRYELGELVLAINSFYGPRSRRAELASRRRLSPAHGERRTQQPRANLERFGTH